MTLTTAQLNKAVVGTTQILRRQQLSVEDIQSLCKFLNAHPHITSVNLFDNDIGDEGAKALAANTTLTTLDVGDNDIGAEEANALIANYNLQVSADHNRLPLSTAYRQALAAKKTTGED